MPRSYGWNAQALLAFEATYGTPPATGYKKMPFVRSSFGSEQGLITSNVLGLGRDPTQPYQDVINVEGEIVVPIDVRNLGQWLKALFGNATVTGTGPYTHTFKSGGLTLPSLTLETGLPQVPAFYQVVGVRANSLALAFNRSGEATATIGLIGQGETRFAATQGGTPTEAVYTRFSQFQGAVKQGGSALANVTAASLTYSNNLQKVETIRSDGKIDGVDPGVGSLNGSVTVRYADNTLIDLASAGSAVDLEFSYTIDATKKLTLTCHEVYLPKPKLAIDGPGGVEASYDFQGAKNTAANAMLTVALINDVSAY